MSASTRDTKPIETKAKALREQLATLIAISEFGRRRYTDPEAYKPVCLALGIQASLLRQAVMIARRTNPTDIWSLGKQYTLMLRMSDAQRDAARELCEERAWPLTGLLRTLIDRWLHEPLDPSILVPSHALRIRKRPQIDKLGETTRYRHDLRIPVAMRAAINARCTAMGLEPSVVVRGLLLDVLAGRRAPPDRLLARAELKARAPGYLVPEGLAL